MVMILGTVALVVKERKIIHQRRETKGSARAKRRPTILTPLRKRKGMIRT